MRIPIDLQGVSRCMGEYGIRPYNGTWLFGGSVGYCMDAHKGRPYNNRPPAAPLQSITHRNTYYILSHNIFHLVRQFWFSSIHLPHPHITQVLLLYTGKIPFLLQYPRKFAGIISYYTAKNRHYSKNGGNIYQNFGIFIISIVLKQ